MNKLKKLPELYIEKCDKRGTVEKVNYDTETRNGEKISKYAYVYLPYGYDQNQKYHILYCLHGGGGEIEVYFGDEDNPAAVRNTLDHMIAMGDIPPIIAVSPTYYGTTRQHNLDSAVSEIEHFCQKELVNDLIPAVEGKYSVYGTREYRGYTGYSMGALSTWHTFLNDLDYFKFFMPMSGDLWVNGESKPEEARKWLEEALDKSQYKSDEFYIYAVTGDKDIAYERMKNLLENIQRKSKVFQYVTEANQEGNIGFYVEPKATHDYIYMPLYFYNGLQRFFKK